MKVEICDRIRAYLYLDIEQFASWYYPTVVSDVSSVVQLCEVCIEKRRVKLLSTSRSDAFTAE
jgi:hypothetical protein